MENKMMVMRRELRDVSRVAEEMTRGTMTGESVNMKTVDAWAKRLCEIISRDLAIPLRQCDVGTPEEQHCRFIEYCNACDCPMGCIHRKQFIGMLDTRCASMLKCYIRWAQMPYEREGAGE